jgi:hypothetical protein
MNKKYNPAIHTAYIMGERWPSDCLALPVHLPIESIGVQVMPSSGLSERYCEFYTCTKDNIDGYVNRMIDEIVEEIGYIPFPEILANLIEKSRDKIR